MPDVRFTATVDRGALEGEVRPFLARRIAAITRRGANNARMRAPVRTGRLGRSITEDPIVFTGPFTVSSGVRANTEYARFVEEGTRPHVIRAKNGGTLAFEIGGRKIFAKSVNHPGTRPRPFLRNSVEEAVQAES